MKINCQRFIENAAAARLYYAVRSLDTHGQGWIEVPHDVLGRALGLAESRVRALLKECLKLGWFYHVKRALGRTYVKYAAEQRLPQKPIIGLINKALLKNPSQLASRVTHIRVIHEQRQTEMKLRYAILKGKFDRRHILDQEMAAAQLRPKAREVRRQAVLLDHTYVVGLTQKTLAERLNLPLPTLKRHLKDVPAVVPFTPRTRWDAEEARKDPERLDIPMTMDAGRIYVRRANFYLDTCTPQAQRVSKITAALKRLPPQLMQIAMASAFHFGYAWSTNGVRKLVQKRGWRKLWQGFEVYLRECTAAGKAKDEWARRQFWARLGKPQEPRPHRDKQPRALEADLRRVIGIDASSQ